ncbi:MAG: glycosyltransferase family 9 protein, partial [Melioribacteraceae bacterium]
LTNNKFIDDQFIFDKSEIFNIEYLYKLINFLRKGYDLAVVPATVSISTTSCLLGRFARAHYRVGPKSLDGKENYYSFLFHKRIVLNWSENSERHVADFGQDIIRPLGIFTDNLKSEITFNKYEDKTAENFINTLKSGEDCKVIGLHIGAGKPPNRWAVENFVYLCKKVNQNFKVKFYITGSGSDYNEIEKFKELANFKCGFYLNKAIPELASVISKSDLFITNDTGVMHVAGATDVPQISLFGPTNPSNWAPVGKNKISLKKSESINDISVDEVYNTAENFLTK